MSDDKSEILFLGSNKFNSTFPEWLLNVRSLEWIDISSNELHGRIPLGLGKLPNLQYLDLSRNYHLEGDISELLRKSWGKKIESLNLGSTDVHDSIPSSIGNFCNLQFLDLSYNNLKGSLPEIINGSEACNSRSFLPNLRELDLFGNELMGKLPNWLGELKSLRRLSLSYEKLEGHIPRLQQLEFLSLGGNELMGSMLDDIAQLSQLKGLGLYSSQLIGTLSEKHFWKLSRLEYLELDNFRLNVSSNWVPSFNLTTLVMMSCDIGSTFPTWFQSQKNLRSLRLLYTSISSFIPNWFGNISFNMEELELYGNQLQGSIPSSIGKSCNLQYLDLSDNNLNGSLPEIINGSETCNSKSPLPNLKELYLFGNQLMGKLPNWLVELKNLRKLRLSFKKLEGTIPRFQQLEFLYLEGNELNGSTLDDIAQLSQLKGLGLYSSQLIGTLSEKHFWKLSRLESLYLQFFRLEVSSNWTPPFQLRTLYMRSCDIGLAFPTWFQSQKNLRSLRLFNASISSFIPNWFENISFNMVELDLSYNFRLQG